MTTLQNTGNMSLTVYYPGSVNNSRAFQTFNSSLTGVTIPRIYFNSVNSEWNTTLTTHFPLGTYRVQARWNSTNATGFWQVPFNIVDKIPPVTVLTNNGTPGPITTITINTVFTINATDKGLGVNYTSISIEPFPAGTMQTWTFLPWNITFTFKDLNVMNAGEYNVSYFSVDLALNIDKTQSLIVNLTRLTSVSVVSISQPEYGLNYSVPYHLYYGENGSVQLSFKDDQGAPVASPISLSAFVSGQNNTSFTSQSAGLFDIPINISTLAVGSYNMIITAAKTGLNLNRQVIGFTIQAVRVNMTLVNIMQNGIALPSQAINGVTRFSGNLLENVAIQMRVNNAINNDSTAVGQVNMLYENDASIVTNLTMAAGSNDLFTFIINSSVQVINNVTTLQFRWIAPNSNYVNTTAGDPKYRFGLLLNAWGVNMTLVSMTQGTTLLANQTISSEIPSVWFSGNPHENVTIVIRVNNAINSSLIAFGQVNMLYKNGLLVVANLTATAGNNSLFTFVIPSSMQVIDTDTVIQFQWIAPNSYYNSTVANATQYQFGLRLRSLYSEINWLAFALILAALAMVGIVYNGVMYRIVIPRRKERHNLLAKISSAFEDAANIQNVMVIHKASGTCLFFKAMGKSSIDPDLITGFLTAIQSFGAEISGSKSLEELTWQDYQLLLGEGNTIRVALVLASKASPILKSLVPQFVSRFESVYGPALKSWRGDLTAFRDGSKIVDEVFDTSIILPHKVADVPIRPKSSIGRMIMDIVKSITKERNYFFLATLLSEAIDKTKRPYGEIIAAIQELRLAQILVPIDIDMLEKKKEITQQDISLIQQRVAGVTFLSAEEKAKLVNDLAQLRPDEREATLSSMLIMGSLQSATEQSNRTGGTLPSPHPPASQTGASLDSKVSVDLQSIKTKKSALKMIKSLENAAAKNIKNFQYKDAISCYETAELVATQWNMKAVVQDVRHEKIDASIRDLEYRQGVVLNEAKNAEKRKEVKLAISKYMEAANLSSSLFKLGVSAEDKKMREYIKKAELLKKSSAP